MYRDFGGDLPLATRVVLAPAWRWGRAWRGRMRGGRALRAAPATSLYDAGLLLIDAP